MTLRGFVIALVLLVPTIARAEPISLASTRSLATVTSSGLTTQSLGLTTFWSGESWDGLNLTDYGASNLQYLNDGSGNYTSFLFEEDINNMTKIGGITAFLPTTNSWDNPGQFALFRPVTAETIHYFLSIEGIPLSFALNDRDYNDFVVKFETPQPVPEPATLLLLGSGMAALAARRKLAARKARGAATV